MLLPTVLRRAATIGALTLAATGLAAGSAFADTAAPRADAVPAVSAVGPPVLESLRPGPPPHWVHWYWDWHHGCWRWLHWDCR